MLLHFDDELGYAQRLAALSGMNAAVIERHRFPDGEVKLRLPPRLPPRTVLLRSLHHPNEKLVELMLAARAARELGATDLTLVAPYLAYMRQDAAFLPGEAVSQRIVGAWLAQLFDAVLTIDPHLHRVQVLRDAIPVDGARALSAAPLLGAALRDSCSLMLGPDAESEPWVRAAAEAAGCSAAVCRKRRYGDCDVEVVLPQIDLTGRDIVVVDDVASTGGTLAAVTRLALAGGAARVDVAVTHPLFVGDAEAVLRAAGVTQLVSTDTVPHWSNRVSTAPLVAEALAARA
ncbi:MAG TPA: ribose-phosphate diphosphokinase [Burkholderiaceae bacterium]|nr:ribose-phosphate diphosphokinase [Burkholderiaceae bacterium]HQR69337.1 ribose-phosphate diphosphokinase [Burkholderiaceae bacterium]